MSCSLRTQRAGLWVALLALSSLASTGCNRDAAYTAIRGAPDVTAAEREAAELDPGEEAVALAAELDPDVEGQAEEAFDPAFDPADADWRIPIDKQRAPEPAVESGAEAGGASPPPPVAAQPGPAERSVAGKEREDGPSFEDFQRPPSTISEPPPRPVGGPAMPVPSARPGAPTAGPGGPGKRPPGAMPPPGDRPLPPPG